MPVRARESVHVIEFERSSLATAPAALVRERAAPTVAFVDRSLDRIRNVARAATSSFGSCRAFRPTANRSFFTSSIKSIECPFQDGGQVPVRHPVPEQVLRL